MMAGRLQHRGGLPLVLFLALVLLASAFPALSDEDPQLLKMRIKSGFVEVDSRYEEQERTSAQTGTLSYDDRRLDVRPKVRLDLDGSVYHPNLIDYILSVELGLSYENERLIQPGTSVPDQKRADTNPLQFYDGRAIILREKKLSGAVFGNYNLIRLDNGFFSRRLVYQTGYGAELNYTGEVIPWTLTAEHREEEETDTRSPRDSMQDELRFKASNSRGAQGRTLFDYLYQDFTRQDFNVLPYAGVRNSSRLSDSSFFLDEFLHLNSSLYYNDINSTTIPSTALTLRELLTAKHTPTLKSTYEYGYGSRDSGATESVNQNGRASLSHRLFDSLVSTVSADFWVIDDTALDTFRYGAEIDESYTKRIGDASSLNLGATFSQHQEDRTSKGGGTIRIINEPHTLSLGQLTFLNQPNVIPSSIVITDPTGSILYLDLIDYITIQRGNVTEIQRVVGGNIPDGGGVLASYDIINPGSGSFSTQQGYYRIRYSLLSRLLSVYGSLRTIKNDGAEHLVLEDLTETVLGIDSMWKWFYAGAEYRDYNSSLLPTESIRFFQSATFALSWKSTLRLSADQTWVNYPQTDEESRRFFQNIAYRTMLTPRLSFKADAGLYLERGRNNASLERDMLAANAELIYRIGKTTVTTTAEYRDEDYLNETRLRKTVYLRVRRVF